MSETERRWGDKAWDVGLRVIGVLLMVICTYFFVRLDAVEKKANALEIRAAVVDEAKNTIMMTLGEIKSDIRDIKEKMPVKHP